MFVFAGCGIFLTFFGKKFFLASIFLVGFVISFFITMSIGFTMIVKEDSEEWVAYTVAGVCFAISLAGGWFAMKMKRYGIKIIGASLGSAVGLLFFDLVLSSVI